MTDKQTVLFDVSRLLSRTERIAPTGVDRVCLAYAEWLLSLPNVRLLPVRSKHDLLVSVNDDWFRDCVQKLRLRWDGELQRSDTPSETALFAALGAERNGSVSVLDKVPVAIKARTNHHIRVWKQFFRSRRMTELPSGKLYFNVGHTSLNSPAILQGLAARGIESVVFLHDLIPITHPEFCRPGDGPKHQARVETALKYASHIVVNSEYTAHELALFAAANSLPTPAIHAARLGLENLFFQSHAVESRRPYFVHVGTIEARKNLAFLLTIWRRLHEHLGETCPQLVLIGRHGWENEAVLDHLERSPNLRGIVHQAANLPDATLARLMSGAQAVLAPSSVEGFDLPAVEACALGVPLIASDIAVHRELVPDAELIDPLDGLGWLEALKRASVKKPQTRPYQAPTWTDHFEQVARSVGVVS